MNIRLRSNPIVVEKKKALVGDGVGIGIGVGVGANCKSEEYLNAPVRHGNDVASARKSLSDRPSTAGPRTSR